MCWQHDRLPINSINLTNYSLKLNFLVLVVAKSDETRAVVIAEGKLDQFANTSRALEDAC